MRWQDVVISIVQLFFIVAMIPSIRSNDKPALVTSIMNVILVSIISFCLLSLHLWFSALTAIAIAMTWGVLAFQKLRVPKHKYKEYKVE